MIFLVGIALADGNFSSAERTAIFRLSTCSTPTSGSRATDFDGHRPVTISARWLQAPRGGDYGAASRSASELETAYEALVSSQRPRTPRSSDAIESS